MLLEWVFVVILYTGDHTERQTHTFETEQACERARATLAQNLRDGLRDGQGFVVKECQPFK